jgi:MFS family permease
VRAALALLRSEREARWFFGALAQSAIGTGAAYVGLLLIAYGSFHSAWAISLILLADFLPSMLLGSVLGAAADRWSRRWCAVVADVIRALAFIGIAFADSFEAVILFALAAGLGTALFRPAALAGLPALVSEQRVAAATSLFSAVSNLSWVVGPGIAAGALLIASPKELMFANGVTFVLSAVVLSRLPLDKPTVVESPGEELPPRTSLVMEALQGGRAVAGMVDIRVVMLATTGAMFFGGVFNVGELLFASEVLDAGEAGYSILVAVYGLGFFVGSLSGAAGGEPPRLTRRYVQGLILTGVGSLCTALAPTLALALVAFLIGGFGNGVFAAHERLLIQRRVPGELHARAFALEDSLVSWALAAAFLLAGAAAALLGPRGLMFATATGEIIVAACAYVALRERMGRGEQRLARSV